MSAHGYRMRPTLLLLIAVFGAGCTAQMDAVPIASGDYKFAVKDAEFDGRIPSGDVILKIRGRHVIVTSGRRASVFPDGLVEEGELMWHASSGQWIIGMSAADAVAPDSGDVCAPDGRVVLDFEHHFYWMC
jgi:hypothetical protein